MIFPLNLQNSVKICIRILSGTVFFSVAFNYHILIFSKNICCEYKIRQSDKNEIVNIRCDLYGSRCETFLGRAQESLGDFRKSGIKNKINSNAVDFFIPGRI